MSRNYSSSALVHNGTSLLAVASGIPWIYLVPAIICPIGVVTNGINVLILKSPRLSDKVFKCLLVSSLADLIYLIISTFSNALLCGPTCNNYSQTYFGNVFILYFVSFGGGFLKLFGVLIEIFLSLQRYTLLSNKPFLMKVSLIKVLPLLLLISVLVNVPNFTNFHIVMFGPSSQSYIFVPNEFGSSNIGKILKAISSWTSICLTLLVLTTLSIITALKSKAYFSKKANMMKNTGSLASASRIGMMLSLLKLLI